MLKWTKHKPNFEFTDYGLNAPRQGHLQFIYDMVRNTKPNLMVELGTSLDGAFFSMCQAIKDDGFPAQAVTVSNRQDPLNDTIKTIRDYHYRNIGHLLTSDFDSAVSHFINESIDILQIDSAPTSDAIRHDYDLWLSKVKPGGAVLVYNILAPEIGSFWGDIKRRYPSLEFTHSKGLGVVFPKGVPTHLLHLVLEDKKRIQEIYEPLAIKTKGASTQSS